MSIVQAKYIFHCSILMFIVFYFLCGCLFFSFRKEEEKSSSSFRAKRQRTAREQPQQSSPLFAPVFFTSDLCLFLLLLAIQSFQTHYFPFHKEIFSSHKALLSVHQRNTIIPISLVRKLRHELHLYGICTAGKCSQNMNAICIFQKGCSKEQGICACWVALQSTKRSRERRKKRHWAPSTAAYRLSFVLRKITKCCCRINHKQFKIRPADITYNSQRKIEVI